MEESYPDKICDYCSGQGMAYTFLTGETICHKCLMSVPLEPRLLRKDIFELRRRNAELEVEIERLEKYIDALHKQG